MHSLNEQGSMHPLCRCSIRSLLGVSETSLDPETVAEDLEATEATSSTASLALCECSVVWFPCRGREVNEWRAQKG